MHAKHANPSYLASFKLHFQIQTWRKTRLEMIGHTADLIEGGFIHAGIWGAEPGGSISYIGDNPIPRDPGVYAYAVDGIVHYVGSAQRGLKKRLRHYEIAKTLRTVHRVRGEILALLSAGKTVDVFVMVPPPLKLNGILPIDTVAGLEEGLIRSLRPIWNRRGLGKR